MVDLFEHILDPDNNNTNNRDTFYGAVTDSRAPDALVSSRLDQVNSILYGAASKHINRLQRVQNALARVVTYQHPYTSPFSSTALLQNLHWLPVGWRVQFKLVTLAYKALYTGQPSYLTELLQQ